MKHTKVKFQSPPNPYAAPAATPEIYSAAVKAAADNSIQNLKGAAKNAAFRVKHFDDSAAEHLTALIEDIENLKDEESMHDDCGDPNEVERLSTYVEELERERDRLSDEKYALLAILEDCESIADGKLLERIKAVIY